VYPSEYVLSVQFNYLFVRNSLTNYFLTFHSIDRNQGCEEVKLFPQKWPPCEVQHIKLPIHDNLRLHPSGSEPNTKLSQALVALNPRSHNVFRLFFHRPRPLHSKSCRYVPTYKIFLTLSIIYDQSFSTTPLSSQLLLLYIRTCE
jgi:hypothetical protein